MAVNIDVVDTFLLAEPTKLLLGGLLVDDVVRSGSISCIAGGPGVGKTSLLRLLLRDTLPETNPEQLTVLYDLSKGKTPESLEEIFENGLQSGNTQVLDNFDANTGNDFIILFDHFTDTACHHGFIEQLLCRQTLPECTIVVATRLEGVEALNCATNFKYSYHFSLKGTRPEARVKLLGHLGQKYKSERLVEYIKYYCLELCDVPGLVVRVLDTFKDKPPQTFTILVESLILDIVNEHIKLHHRDIPQLKSLQELSVSNHSSNIAAHFRLISKLAYLLLESDTDRCCLSDLVKYVTLDNASIQSKPEKIGLGLLSYVSHVESDATVANWYKFVHLTIQQFLAAYHIAMEPLLDQIDTFCKGNMLSDRKFQNVCRFYFGMCHALGKSKSEGLYTLKPLLENIGSELNAEGEVPTESRLLFMFQLMHESQDRVLTHKIISRVQEKDLILSLERQSLLTEPLIASLVFVLANSGISNWRVITNDRAEHTVEYLSMSVKTVSKNRVELSVDFKETSDSFILKPQSSRKTNCSRRRHKMYSEDTTCVRCMREILHGILQLFSPIKLKSDGNEPSYISVLACSCLKEKLEEQVLVIEPIQALHWQTVPIKEKSIDENSELYHHMTRHDMKHSELVLMMSPLPSRIIYFKDLITKDEKLSIELSRGRDPHFMDGNIAASSVKQSRDAVERSCIEEKSIPSFSLSKMVPLPWPIPKSHMDNIFDSVVLNMGDNLPPRNERLSPADNQKEDEGDQPLENNLATGTNGQGMNATKNIPIVMVAEQQAKTNVLEATEATVTHNEIRREDVPGVVVTEPRRTQQYGYSNPFNHYQSSQQSVQQSLPTSAQKQVIFKPGMILYTTVPDIFVLHELIAIPEEKNLLKRGGNGAIYGITYSGFDFAVKKTAYRNREIEIHKKLLHPNVIELSCLLFGNQIPHQAKRFYSYHFMPRLTGDLAKLVTDRANLTMVSLSERYGDEPLKLGLMQGNWKFILKEVLKGLNYMHSLNIIHRDMKASNVLIKLRCNCDNPLTCTCAKKYSVRIADFDAAIELDSNGNLKPSVSNRLSADTYHIVPVGTDGYRAPECAQLISSNNLSILSPPLTTKADIWSLGLIVMRMLNGRNGPTRQQPLSTLLLYYEQEKHKENPHQTPKRPKFMKISREEVDSVIGLDKFRDISNGWVRKAVDCIAKCVEVDPEKRPPAEELLQHSFLF